MKTNKAPITGPADADDAHGDEDAHRGTRGAETMPCRCGCGRRYPGLVAVGRHHCGVSGGVRHREGGTCFRRCTAGGGYSPHRAAAVREGA